MMANLKVSGQFDFPMLNDVVFYAIKQFVYVLQLLVRVYARCAVQMGSFQHGKS